MNKNTTMVLIVVLVLVIAGVFWLNSDVSGKKAANPGQPIVSKGLVYE